MYCLKRPEEPLEIIENTYNEYITINKHEFFRNALLQSDLSLLLNKAQETKLIAPKAWKTDKKILKAMVRKLAEAKKAVSNEQERVYYHASTGEIMHPNVMLRVSIGSAK